jgi:UDP-N-acetylmuramoyl-tripeptide--D-alanyl-D-alanine ligase
VRDLYSKLFPVVASPNSFNNEIGVPHTLLLGERETRLFAIEMGTNHQGEIATLSRIARPTAGIITNVGASHLEGLGSLEGVAREKGDLAAAIPAEGFVVLNADSRFTPAIRLRTSARVITFGIAGTRREPADLEASAVVFHSGGTSFRLNGCELTSPLLGTHNVENLLAALAIALGLGIPLSAVLPGVATLQGGRQRMERVDLAGVTVFDDSYNCNPDSARAAVRILAGLHGFRRRVLVLGDMYELGDLAAELHHQVGVDAATSGIDLIVLVGELTKAAAAGALEGGLPKKSVVHLPTSSQAVRDVGALLQEGDVVLVKGSRKMELERVVRQLEKCGSSVPSPSASPWRP